MAKTGCTAATVMTNPYPYLWREEVAKVNRLRPGEVAERLNAADSKSVKG